MVWLSAARMRVETRWWPRSGCRPSSRRVGGVSARLASPFHGASALRGVSKD
jgi:hypothetical protein